MKEEVGQKRETSTKDESNELEKPAKVARKSRLLSSLHPGFHTEQIVVRVEKNGSEIVGQLRETGTSVLSPGKR